MDLKTTRPLHDIVIVKLDNKEETTSSGLVLSAAAQKDPTSGEVFACGPEVPTDHVEPGDTVVFTSNGLRKDTVDGVTYVWMKLESILGTL